MSLTIDALVLRRADGAPLLGPLSLSLSAGDRLGLVGESGSGKSLLAQATFGVLPPGVVQSKGTVTAFGIPMDRPDPGRGAITGARLAWVPQDPGQALNPFLTVAEHLALLPGIHRGESPGAALARLAPLLERLRLPTARAFLDRFPHQISGGQRQRVCLAMALSCDPELLILDEPTTALDSLTQREFLDLALDLRRERGLGFLWITHDLALATAACDRLVVLYGGEVMETGSATSILASPRHPYTARLLEAARRQPSAEDGFLPAPQDRPAGCPFQPRCSRGGADCVDRPAWTHHPDPAQRRLGFGLRCRYPLPIPS
jgi:oligopeptide/dipeptide ABC transporter ATP-binding protein